MSWPVWRCSNKTHVSQKGRTCAAVLHRAATSTPSWGPKSWGKMVAGRTPLKNKTPQACRSGLYCIRPSAIPCASACSCPRPWCVKIQGVGCYNLYGYHLLLHYTPSQATHVVAELRRGTRSAIVESSCLLIRGKSIRNAQRTTFIIKRRLRCVVLGGQFVVQYGRVPAC